MKKLILFFAVLFMGVVGYGQSIAPASIPFSTATITSCSTSVVPPTILNGVSITETFTGDVQNYINSWSSCGLVTTPPNSKHLGQNNPFTYTMNFSQPINNLIFVLTGTGHQSDETFTVTTNVGNPLITMQNSCFTTITGNVITSGAGAINGGGGGMFTVTAPTPFTSITIAGPGGVAGSLLSVCSSSIFPCNTPTFVQVAPICSGAILTALPTTSTNGITGSWSPALNNLATTTYTFTPTAGVCANITTMTIVVNPKVTPTFVQVAPICSGAILTALPTTSINGITGTWSPALNNLATTTYTFTPTAGLCANTKTMTITVNPRVVPTFTQVAPICLGTVLTLPTTSNNGITGTWNPAPNNSATTTYTFTPTAGVCANTTNMTVNVNPYATCNNCNNGLTLSYPETNNIFLYKNRIITTNNNYTINAGKDIKMKADHAIVLKPNTRILLGSTYLGMIEDCSGGGGDKTVAKHSNPQTIVKEDLSIYPNPTNDFITISSESLEIGNIMIVSFDGKVVYNKAANSHQEQIDLSNYASGIYFLTAETKNGETITKKIIKK